MGGGMQGRRDPQLAGEREALAASGIGTEVDQVLGLDDLVAGEDAFFSVTAVTDSPFLEGVRYDTRHNGVTTESLTIRAGSGSVRYVRGIHQLDPEHIFGDRDPGDAVEAATSG
jgi:fructose-1,6-bisphosphatase II